MKKKNKKKKNKNKKQTKIKNEKTKTKFKFQIYILRLILDLKFWFKMWYKNEIGIVKSKVIDKNYTRPPPRIPSNQ